MLITLIMFTGCNLSNPTPIPQELKKVEVVNTKKEKSTIDSIPIDPRVLSIYRKIVVADIIKFNSEMSSILNVKSNKVLETISMVLILQTTKIKTYDEMKEFNDLVLASRIKIYKKIEEVLHQ